MASASGSAFGVNLFAPNTCPISETTFRRYARELQREADVCGLDLSNALLVEDDDCWPIHAIPPGRRPTRERGEKLALNGAGDGLVASAGICAVVMTSWLSTVDTLACMARRSEWAPPGVPAPSIGATLRRSPAVAGRLVDAGTELAQFLAQVVRILGISDGDSFASVENNCGGRQTP